MQSLRLRMQTAATHYCSLHHAPLTHVQPASAVHQRDRVLAQNLVSNLIITSFLKQLTTTPSKFSIVAATEERKYMYVILSIHDIT